MNDDATLREIEDALEGVDGLDWIRVEDPGLVTARGSPRRLYRLTLTPDALACPDVHHLELAVPLQFPYEPPAVYAPGAGTTVPWPHVEPDDRLCLIASRFDVDAATRVLEILQWAVNLLNQDEQMRRSEFDREFLSYWPCRPSGLHVLSLVTLDAPSRTVSWCIDAGTGRFVMADDEGALRRWMARADRGLRANAVHDGAYVRLIELPEPGTYPETGARLEEMIRTSGAPLPPLHVGARVPAARMARLGRRHPQTGRAADRPGTRGRRRAGRGMAMSPAPPPVFGARAPAPGIDQCLLFADRVVARFERHRQRGAPDLEAGGQLFGTVDDRAVRLIDASGPGSGDERGRTHFRSCPVRAQRAIERRARRGLLYLGEWHTHPEVVPRPSPQDRLAMSSLLRDSRPNTDPLLMVIVGRQPGTGGWHVESCDRWNNRLVWEATLSG